VRVTPGELSYRGVKEHGRMFHALQSTLLPNDFTGTLDTPLVGPLPICKYM